jgi:hypothetical protein
MVPFGSEVGCINVDTFNGNVLDAVTPSASVTVTCTL